MARRAKGVRNAGRPNGKAWKQGKHPDLRAAEAKAKAGR
jgi:hypothetical protein